MLPYCHFHLEESDYLTANRRSPELRGPYGTLDASTQVIEFTSIGVNQTTTRLVLSLWEHRAILYISTL